MEIDREEICNVISAMLDKPDNLGIYHTSTAYTKLEHYINKVRVEAIGATHAWACVKLDEDKDPRTENCCGMMDDLLNSLSS
jgi:hypothetical protein